ncbi:pimeloyl-ACP methyl ester carboxylesterase [Arthrobacter sp. SLBN-83]|uniref:alpha/beta fold hydrolase n=1 Tax=Arthrobacter sp. SLBN-83 TaxID=2768449 RepID=UPI00114E0D97|nr:alpha/beta hydrolase [Arthrobacter sp. SLBN-83]TQJ61469.1 pimeloyl-ACP methyl ester carboxylesterase [Arthrobacter sp. SLBN-83]
MSTITVANGTTLNYDTFGPSAGSPLVLIEGLTAQMIKWRPELCQLFVDAGFHVIRFDNRDVGLSQKFDGQEYSITDMAEDTAGLIRALGIAPANIVGQSMGGMIAQELAIAHPELVASLALIYTTASAKWLLPQAADREILKDQSSFTREEAILEFLAGEQACRSRDYAQDVNWLRRLAAEAYDRDPVKSGNARQAKAVFTAPDRVEKVQAISAPAVILTGDADLLIDHKASDELHNLIDNSYQRVFPGMGHEIPKPLWPDFVSEITNNASRATAASAA